MRAVQKIVVVTVAARFTYLFFVLIYEEKICCSLKLLFLENLISN